MAIENGYDVVIIGGGPAGASAGIYAARRRLKTIIFEKGLIGGAINTASLLENYPGFKPAPGMEFGSLLKEQLENLHVEIKTEEIKEIERTDKGFIIKDSDISIETKTILIATGSKYKKLNIPGEEEFFGKGVAFCATCDAPLFINKTVAVVGGGDNAFRSAQVLAEGCKKVYLIHRREEFRATDKLVDEIKQKENIEFILNTTVTEILGEHFVDKIKIKNTKTNEEKELPVDGIFVNIGIIPVSNLAEKFGIALDEKKHIIVDKNKATNIPGVFAAGDVAGTWEQAITAAADGALAAVSAYRYIKAF